MTTAVTTAATAAGEALIDPVVKAIEAAEGDEVAFAQREVPVVTSEMLNALRLSGKTLVVEADGYTIRIAGTGREEHRRTGEHGPELCPSEYGVTFTLNGGAALPASFRSR